MSLYREGDVLLARVRLGEGGREKVRPVLVMGLATPDALVVCPISSRPPRDAPSVALSLTDFQEGGLDILNDSYLLPSIRCTITAGDVIARKGRLFPGVIALDGDMAGSVGSRAARTRRSRKAR